MTYDLQQASALRRPAAGSETAIIILASGLVCGYAGCLVMAFVSHVWLIDGRGQPVPFDFLVFWSAGRMALAGHAAAVFDLSQLRTAEVATVGHKFSNILPWPYPPVFLLVAASLSFLPYAAAFVAWIGSTLIAQACVVSAIARRAVVFVVALAPPWILLGVLNGQNGFLTATIFGAVLLLLEERPVLSGFLLGFLCYKPQLALLFPLALAFGGYWRAFIWAALGVLFWTAISCAVFGTGILGAFLHGLSVQNHVVLAGNGVAPFNLQSIYGLARWLGAGAFFSGALQLCLSAVCALSVIVIWRSAASFNLKAATLAAAAPLTTPYLFVSDLAILSIAVSFLFRDRPFDKSERAALAFAMTFVFAFIFRTYPAGLFASLTVSAIVWRRYLATMPSSDDVASVPELPSAVLADRT